MIHRELIWGDKLPLEYLWRKALHIYIERAKLVGIVIVGNLGVLAVGILMVRFLRQPVEWIVVELALLAFIATVYRFLFASLITEWVKTRREKKVDRDMMATVIIQMIQKISQRGAPRRDATGLIETEQKELLHDLALLATLTWEVLQTGQWALAERALVQLIGGIGVYTNAQHIGEIVSNIQRAKEALAQQNKQEAAQYFRRALTLIKTELSEVL